MWKIQHFCRRKHCFVNIEFYVWQERDFESTCLTDDSWVNVVFRSRPSSLWQQKQETGFPFWILFQTRTSTINHSCNIMVMVGDKVSSLLHRNALLARRRPRIQGQVRMHVRSLAIQDQTAFSRAEGLSDMWTWRMWRRRTRSPRCLVWNDKPKRIKRL